jgi:SPP1 gp7 family putative phage head morphogenesis protein
VGSVFGIPPVVLGWKVGLENSPWSQMEQARQMTYEDTIEPRWRDIEKKMTRQLLTPEEREAGLRLVFDTTNVRALQADDELRSRVAGSMRREWTLNERRTYTGKDPLPADDERGDGIEGGSSGAAGGLGGLDGLFLDGDDDGGTITAGMRVLLRSGKAIDRKSLEWAIFDLSTKAAESTWERRMMLGLDDLKAKILALLDKELSEKQVDPDSAVSFISIVAEFLKETAEEGLFDLVLPLIVSTGTTAVRRAAAQTGLSFAVLQPGLLTYAHEEAGFLASVMGETTGRRVAKVVQDQLAGGGTIGAIRKALVDDLSFSRDRARMVARTETTRAWNGSQRRSLAEWQQEQPEAVRVVKSWLTARDDRVRPEHDDMDGEQRAIDDLYSNGLQEPGEPNCRCTQIFDIESPSR